jgi:hypothetical protein
MKIRTTGRQAFNVPNNEEGHLFVRLLQKFRNRGWYYRARGRGSRQEHGNQYSIPQEHAEWLAVYLRSKWTEQSINALVDMYSPTGRIRPVEPEPQPVAMSQSTVYSVPMAEWSHPIEVGSPVAINAAGQVYAVGLHGMEALTNRLGTAVSNSNGPIGEGEGQINIVLDPAVSHRPLLQSAIGEKAPEPENEVELTVAEQEMLGSLLQNWADTEVEYWPEEEGNVFQGLYEKLVD